MKLYNRNACQSAAMFEVKIVVRRDRKYGVKQTVTEVWLIARMWTHVDSWAGNRKPLLTFSSSTINAAPLSPSDVLDPFFSILSIAIAFNTGYRTTTVETLNRLPGISNASVPSV